MSRFDGVVYVNGRCGQSVNRNCILPSVKHRGSKVRNCVSLWLGIIPLVHIQGNITWVMLPGHYRESVHSLRQTHLWSYVHPATGRPQAHEQASQGPNSWKETGCTHLAFTKHELQSYRPHLPCAEKSRKKISHKQARTAGTLLTRMKSYRIACGADVGEGPKEQLSTSHES